MCRRRAERFRFAAMDRSTDPRASVRQSTAALTLLALGIVYGDIGTSPLYAAKETFNPEHGIALTADRSEERRVGKECRL